MYIPKSTRRGRFPLAVAIIAVVTYTSASQVVAQAPDWSVDASAFEHSHNATAAVLQGQVRLSGNDHRLAAFVGDELRGAASPTEVSGQWLFFLTIHGETAGERVTFRVYDAAADRVFDITQTLDFSVNGITGSPSTPFWLEMSSPTGSDSRLPSSARLRLHQNAPNPFSRLTEIPFEIPQEAHVSVEIFDLVGRRVRILMSDRVTAGSHTVRFDSGDLPAGAYLYRIRSGTESQTRLMVAH